MQWLLLVRTMMLGEVDQAASARMATLSRAGASAESRSSRVNPWAASGG